MLATVAHAFPQAYSRFRCNSMHPTILHNLVRSALDELRAPVPGRNWVVVLPEGIPPDWRGTAMPSLSDLGPEARATGYKLALSCLQQLGVKVCFGEAAGPLTRFFSTRLADAVATAYGALDLRVVPVSLDAGATLVASYDLHRASDGRRCYVSRRGTVPLLVLTAYGFPAGVWQRLISDWSHDYRLIFCETSGWDLFEGGMDSDYDFRRCADEVDDVLARLDLGGALHLLSWSNAARPAVELANRHPETIASLSLLAPALRSCRTPLAQSCSLELAMEKLFRAALAHPKAASGFCRMLDRLRRRPDTLRGIDEAAEAAWSLPPASWEALLRNPFASPEALLNYAKSALADQTTDMENALAQLSQPVLLVVGENDEVIHVPFVRHFLGQRIRRLETAILPYAGHYIQHLQYPYFGKWLDGFLARARHATPTETPISASTRIAGRGEGPQGEDGLTGAGP